MIDLPNIHDDQLDRYNLIDEAWIPAVTASGDVEWVQPHEIVRDDLVDVYRFFPESYLGYLHFLIGLVQTYYPPRTGQRKAKINWEARLDCPPSKEDLRSKFLGADHVEHHREAFDLLGDGPRYMQHPIDPDPEYEMGRTELYQSEWMDETYGLEFGTQHIDESCTFHPAVLAPLLTTHQAYNRYGGSGKNPSNKRWASILHGDTLWDTVWLNVVQRSKIEGGKTTNYRSNGRVTFPWMHSNLMEKIVQSGGEDYLISIGPTNQTPLTPESTYWLTPRHMWIDKDCSRVYQRSTSGGNCFKEKNLKHPLTPFNLSDKKDHHTPLASTVSSRSSWLLKKHQAPKAENIKRWDSECRGKPYIREAASRIQYVGILTDSYSGIDQYFDVSVPAQPSYAPNMGEEECDDIDDIAKDIENLLSAVEDILCETYIECIRMSHVETRKLKPKIRSKIPLYRELEYDIISTLQRINERIKKGHHFDQSCQEMRDFYDAIIRASKHLLDDLYSGHPTRPFMDDGEEKSYVNIKQDMIHGENGIKDKISKEVKFSV